MTTKPTRWLALSALLFAPAHTIFANPADDWEKFNDWSIGGLLFPNLHFHGVGGFSTGKAEELASGGHDPKRDPFSAQAIEPGLSVRTQYFEAFSNYLFYQDTTGDWDGELEEAFGKCINIPGGFEIKGGRYLTRFGALNDKHLHAWDFVDAEISNARMLGEDGLLLEGAELSWTLPLGLDPAWVSIASLGYGNAPAHDHEEEHEHEGEEIPHEADGAFVADDVVTARLMARNRINDFHSITAGTSWAGGTNGFGRDTNVFGMDVEYLWRENGLEKGGRAFRWRTEWLWRDVDAFSQHDENGDGVIDETFVGNYDENGIHSHAIMTWSPRFDSGLRVAWIGGVDDFGQAERFRVSPSFTWWLDDARRVGLRTQYNFDSIASADDEQSLWLQLNIALGSVGEVR